MLIYSRLLAELNLRAVVGCAYMVIADLRSRLALSVLFLLVLATTNSAALAATDAETAKAAGLRDEGGASEAFQAGVCVRNVLVSLIAGNAAGETAGAEKQIGRESPVVSAGRGNDPTNHAIQFVSAVASEPVQTPEVGQPSEALLSGIRLRNFIASLIADELSSRAAKPDVPNADAPPADANRATSDRAIGSGILHVVLSPVKAVSELADDANVTVPSNFLYVRFSKPFLEKHFCKQFDRTAAVNDCILGAAVSGTSHTIGQTQLDLADNPSQAQAMLRFAGTTWFDTVSSSGPIQISSHGTTVFSANQQLWFDGKNLDHNQAGSTASTHTSTTGICTSLRFILGRISLRIASRREAATHQLAESITAQHTEKRVDRGFDSVVEDRTTTFTDLLKSRYAKLPLEGQFKVTDIRCSTTPSSLQIVLIGEGDKTPVFARAPAPLPDKPDIELHIHTALLKKALVDSQLRATLEAAIGQFTDQPLAGSLKASTAAPSATSGEKPEYHWPEGANSQWLSISWNPPKKANGLPAER